MMSGSRRRREAGFSLIEAVVALAIVGIGMTAFYRAVGASYGMQARIRDLSATVELAQSQLDGLGVVAPLAPGTMNGRYATGFAWQMDVALLSKGAAREEAQAGLPSADAYWVVLQVRDRRGRLVLQLETARVSGALP